MRAPFRLGRWGGVAALVATLLATPFVAPFATAQGHGPTVDDVTGWRCISPFCDVVIQPVTRCLCRKDNPGETVATRLRLTCLPDRNSPSCAGSTRFTIR